MSKETKLTMFLILVVSVVGMILMWFSMEPDLSSSQPKEAYYWLQATQILFGF